VLKAEGKPLFSRTDGDIMACILESSNDSPSEERLIYRCNLNLSQLSLYRDYLVEAGFLKFSKQEDGEELLQATKNGREALIEYQKIKIKFNENSSKAG